MNLDGSGATQLTRTQGDEIVNPVLSPDGSRFAAMRGTGRGGADGAALARLDPTQPTKFEPLQPPEGGGFIEYVSWSRDGTRLAGSFRRPSGQGKLATYTLASGAYRVFDVDAGNTTLWVNGDRTLLYMRSGSLYALDVATAREHEVLNPARLGGGTGAPIQRFGLSNDERSLFVIVWRDQSNIWQVTLP
jgi:Tol biopolymer transport system component